MIADVYSSVRASKIWPRTLLIITYDEHGGIYDHVAPPAAPMPAPARADQVFMFDRYGVRVPAVIVSAYVEPGTAFGTTTGQPYDHTSIIATVRKRFNLAPLTSRDAGAPNLGGVLTRPAPDNNGPTLPLKALPYAPSVQTAARRQTQPLNSMQKALLKLAANFPDTPGQDLQAHLTTVKAQGMQEPPPAITNVHAARSYVKQQVGKLFSR